MKSFYHRMRPGQLARFRRNWDGARRWPPDPSHVAATFIHWAVGWSLHDPVVWGRLHELFVEFKRGPDGGLVKVGPLPIPPLPPGKGREWKTIFDCVYYRFRSLLAAHREGEVWTSYSLSYLALRRCALRRRHEELAYVYEACANEHKRFYKRLLRRRERSSDGLERVGVEPEAVDLLLDFEDVLRRLSPRDAAVCRMRLVEGRTFQEIGEAMGVDQSTAKRWFDRRAETIRAALGAYDVEPVKTVSVVSLGKDRAVAA